jgi:hypothetical protein
MIRYTNFLKGDTGVQAILRLSDRNSIGCNVDIIDGYISELRLSLWPSGQISWLQIQRSRVRFPAVPDFLRSSGSGTGSTQPREYN